jgi:glutamin-(asparagin-)ase
VLLTQCKPNIAILGTGGTIAGKERGEDARVTYDCSSLLIDEVLASCVGIDSKAKLSTQQISQKGSENFSLSDFVAIGREVQKCACDDSIDAVIVAQGTNTIEELAYFINLTVPTSKPLVVVGAMRPPSAMGSDVRPNLYDAVCVAASSASRGMGTLVVMNSEIHAARDVIKSNNFQLGAFGSQFGPLGYVIDGVPRYYRSPIRKHTTSSEFDVRRIRDLPTVQMIPAYEGLSTRVLTETILSSDGVVVVGSGGGAIPESLIGAIRDAQHRGAVVVRASRSGEGVVVRNAAHPDDEYDWLVVDDQQPAKARILLGIALHQIGADRSKSVMARLQRYFYEY